MTPAVKLLKKQQQRFQVHEYVHDPAAPSYGLEAAEKLQLEPGRVFKTLVARASCWWRLFLWRPVWV